jgi:transposase
MSVAGLADLVQSLQKSDEVAVESTGNTQYFVEQIQGRVKVVRVVNPNQFKVITRSVKKTDAHDALTLARYLQKGLIPEVRMRSKAEAQLHSLLGTRDKMIKLRSALKNKLHNILNANGLVTPRELFSSEKSLDAVMGLALASEDHFEVRIIVEQVRSLNAAIDQINEEVRRRGQQLPGHKNLTSITGVGDITATILLNAIGDIADFSEPKKLAAYLGIVPRVAQSNETSHYGHITKMGNKLARTALVQSTLIAIKYNAYLRSFYRRLQTKKGSGKAIIATARKLLTIIYYTLKNQWLFTDFNRFQRA